MSRPLLAFVAVIVAGAMLQGYGFQVGLGQGYWLAVLVVAAVAAIGLKSSARLLGPPPGSSEFLCDSCKLNHERYCRRPERPNATRCDDYDRQAR